MKDQQNKKQDTIRSGYSSPKRRGVPGGGCLGRLCLAVNLMLYIGFALADGPVWCRDSNSYATMDYTREPAYCTFLWLMRKVFGDTILVHGWDLTDRLGGKAAAQEPLYLMAAIVCQAAVMAVTVWYLARVCHILGGRRLALAANAVMWGVELLNRFGAKRGSAYFQSIMTEGFGIPFYILFLLFLFQYLRCRARQGAASCGGADGASWKKYLLASAGMMTLCTSHHKQLGITLLIFAVCTIGADLWKLLRRKQISSNDSEQGMQASTRHSLLRWDAAALAGAGVLIFLIGHLYNLGFHGVWSFHTGSADKIDSTLLYTVTEEDAALFDRYGTEELKGLFLQIEEQLQEQSLRYVDVMRQEAAEASADSKNAADAELANTDTGQTNADAELANTDTGQTNADPKQTSADAAVQDKRSDAKSSELSGGVSWVELCSHYADSYDIIGFEVLDPLVDAYVREHQPELTPGSMEFAIATDAVCQEIEHVLVHQNPARLLHLWVNNVRKGFVNTVLRVSTVLNWAALVLWGIYIALLCRMAWHVKSGKCAIPSDSGRDQAPAAESHGEGRKPSDECLGRGGIPNTEFNGNNDIMLLAGLVLIGTAINCMVVGAIIFPQTRYMIYNMGLFYVCLLAMLEKYGWHRSK